jgi:hypothetical protein
VAANGRSPSKAPVEHGSERNPPALPAGTKEDDMKKYLLATAAALTLGLSAPMVSADPDAIDRVADSSKVGKTGNVAEIDQSGFNPNQGGNDANIDQTRGTKGAAYVEQVGNSHTATVIQTDTGDVDSGRDNRAQVTQFGSHQAVANVTQDHYGQTEAGGTSDNRAEVEQSNANKSYAEINQSGSANDAVLKQNKSNFASATINQTETAGNSALIWQDGADNATATIDQSGEGSNLADVFQMVDNAWADVDQDGFGNNAYVDQQGVAGGFTNTATVSQSGVANNATVQQ